MNMISKKSKRILILILVLILISVVATAYKTFILKDFDLISEEEMADSNRK